MKLFETLQTFKDVWSSYEKLLITNHASSLVSRLKFRGEIEHLLPLFDWLGNPIDSIEIIVGSLGFVFHDNGWEQINFLFLFGEIFNLQFLE